MITIQHTDFTSNQSLKAILAALTKEKMLNICKKLDLYVSPNLKKEVTAERVAEMLLDNPTSILCKLSKGELQIIDEIVKAGPNQYILRKRRKTQYKLQQYGLVLTYEDDKNDQWHLLMPDKVRESLSASYRAYLDFAEKGIKGPTPKDLRYMSMLNQLYGEKEE